MKKKEREFSFWSLLWTLLLHGGVVLLLLLLHLNKPVLQAESGIPVELGDMGNLDTDYEFTDITELPAPASVSVPQPTVPDADVTITQDLEETVTLDKVEEESVADQERRVQEEAQNLMANVFGNSRNMQSSGEEPKPDDVPGTPGSTEGNSTQGQPIGVGGFGGPRAELGNRSVVEMKVPSNENIPEEAMVVVSIWVDSEGNVTRTEINRRTKTMNADLRQRSINAAKQTKFNSIPPDVSDATGTITYFYQYRTE